MIILRNLLRMYGDLLYKQDWYWGEGFMDEQVAKPDQGLPVGVSYIGIPPHLIDWDHVADLLHVTQLVWLYVQDPDDPVWKRYLWTATVDGQGQRVFVGDNGNGLEIHRHLHLTDRWGVPSWT